MKVKILRLEAYDGARIVRLGEASQAVGPAQRTALRQKALVLFRNKRASVCVCGPAGAEGVRCKNGRGPALSGYEVHDQEPGYYWNIIVRH